MNTINEDISPLGIYKEGMPWNPVEKVIMERRSVRRFKKETLPDNLIRRILESARFAPSTGNGQPWKFVVVKSPQIIAEMENDAARITKFFMFFYGYTMYKGLRRIISKLMANFSVMRLYSNEFSTPPFFAMTQAAEDQTVYFQGAPVVIFILADKRGVSNPSVDVGIAGEHIVLAAHSLGVGTCWMGFSRLLTYYPKWRKKLGLNKYPYRFGNCICLGYPAYKADAEVPREVQSVEWHEGSMKDFARFERQGE